LHVAGGALTVLDEPSRRTIDAALGDALDCVERAAFWARVDHGLADVAAVVAELYPQHDPGALVERFLSEVAAAAGRRKPALRDLDMKRMVDPTWFQSNAQVGYVAYASRYGGTLDGVRGRVEHLRQLGVSYLHLMHVLKARPGANDGGYAVVDYGDVEPELGRRAPQETFAD
jgi:amylosucrase